MKPVCVQILKDNHKHWLCVFSTLKNFPSTVHVHASLFSKECYRPSVCALLGTETNDVTHQVTRRRCIRLWAVCHCHPLSHGTSPGHVTWDLSRMRSPVCFENGKMSIFPGALLINHAR